MMAKVAGWLLVVALLLGGWGWWQGTRVVAATARAEAAEAKVAGYKEAAALLDSHLIKVRAERDRWAAMATELELLEGVDEPLNDYERAVLDRVRKP